MAFAAGQFNMLYVFGVGEVPISISGNPENPETLLHTVRAVGTVTKAICSQTPGDFLGVRGPFGTRWPVEEAVGGDVILVAGGLGLAPLRPAVYQLLARRKEFGRVTLLYGARSSAEMLYRQELARWGKQLNFGVRTTVDQPAEGWEGNVGVVTTLIPEIEFNPQEAVAMVCGPEVMMRFTVLELRKRGMPEEKIFISMERNMKCGVRPLWALSVWALFRLQGRLCFSV